jgi:hypothetical protein
MKPTRHSIKIADVPFGRRIHTQHADENVLNIRCPERLHKLLPALSSTADGNWSSFQLAIIAHPLGVICSDIAPSARMLTMAL